MSDIAIRVEHLAKRYSIGEAVVPYNTLRDTVAGFVRSTFRRTPSEQRAHVWALDDVSCDIKRGEVVGLIGGNGAGKSTLLKILSRITSPTRGRARIMGRVGSLLEVGTGFHPELTGRENIFLNGAILGMARREIARKFDDIVAFAEVDRFIDTAVKYYSSGMYVRLAFAVAAHLEPEILIVDEVLSVGDARFQQKCLGKMDDVAKSGRTVLFVTHNMAAVQRLATSAILLERGRLVGSGAVRPMVARYLGGHSHAGYEAARRTGKPQVLESYLIDQSGQPAARPLNTDAFGFHIRFVLPEARSGVRVGMGVLAADGTVVFTSGTDDVSLDVPAEAGEFDARVMVPGDTLLAGDYHLALCVWDSSSGDIFDLQEPALSFSLEYGPSIVYNRGDDRKGFVNIPCAWTMTPAAPAPSASLIGQP
ncbi:MAG: ATP-binding cassette domain-containing protein [Acidobacteria bacterium]|nr:ATP-binding cassette domain-containing protein [Acidobacteriota bacterium]